MHRPQTITYTIRQGDNLYQLSRHYKTTVQAILSQNPNLDPYNLQIGAAIDIRPGEEFAMPSGYPASPSCPNPSMQIQLNNDMREVWEQHVYWTRMLLISIAERLKDESDVAARLLENPKDIADIFARFYTADVAKSIEKLLTEHLQIGAALITSLRDGQPTEHLERQWYANADAMAAAFSSISPYYGYEELRKMLYSHLNLTTQEVAARLAHNYPADIKAFDRVEQEALLMADYFSSGLMRQFPQRFH